MDFLCGFDRPILEGTLIKRYKRFLADISLPGRKSSLTVHCPNTGSMKGLNIPGRPVLISDSQNKERKLRYTLEAIKIGKTWVCVNTHRANALTKIILEKFPQTVPYKFDSFLPEQKYMENTRFDFLLKSKTKKQTFLEVKAVTLSEEKGLAKFPDAVTERGQKHLNHLMKWKESGNQSIIFFLCMRNDCNRFRPAKEIDPKYGEILEKAAKSGVSVVTSKIHITKRGFYRDPSNLQIELS